MSYRDNEQDTTEPTHRASWWRRQSRVTRGVLAVTSHAIVVNGMGAAAASLNDHVIAQFSLAMWTIAAGILLVVHMLCRTLEGWDP